MIDINELSPDARAAYERLLRTVRAVPEPEPELLDELRKLLPEPRQPERSETRASR